MCGATIIESKNNGHSTLIVVGNSNNVIQFVDLTNYHKTGSITWQSVTSAHNSRETRLVSLSSHEALEVAFSMKS